MKTIPIFFASNDRYVPYLDVAILSIMEHASKENKYEITILKSDISEENQRKLKKHNSKNFSINFFDVKEVLEPIRKTLPDMFYYTLAAYYRLFIETAFPQYDKVIYLDCDIVAKTDIAELFDQEIGNNLIAGVCEQNTWKSPEFTYYVDNMLGIDPKTYFNSGVMLMNLKEFRKFGVQKRFLDMLIKYNFDCLAPDQEYLNVICHGKVKYLPNGWNKQSFPEPAEGGLKICHYALANKPWHYSDTINGQYFWEYAKKSEFYKEILHEFESFSEEDKRKDYEMFKDILAGIERLKTSEKTFKKLWFDEDAGMLWKNQVTD